MPPFTGLAGVVAGGQAQAEELRRRRLAEQQDTEQQEIQRIAMMNALASNDVTTEPENITAELPDVGTIGQPRRAPQTVDTGVRDPRRYQSLGKAGGQEYFRDKARGIAAERAAEQQARVEQALKQSTTLKNLADAGQPKAPVRGTPEYVQAVKDEAAARAEHDKGPAGSWQFGRKNGQEGYFNPTTREFVVADGFAPVAAGQAGDAEKKARAFRNMSDALDGLEAKLKADGSSVIPSVESDELATLYQNTLLQAKEMYELGVLNGPDYIIMQRVLSDPTSLVGRARSFGSGKEQAKRVLAQIAHVRKIVGNFQENTTPGAKPAAADHSTMSDEEFAAAWKAGKFKTP